MKSSNWFSLTRWSMAILFYLVISYISSLSTNELPHVHLFENADKIIHFFEYFILSGLILRAVWWSTHRIYFSCLITILIIMCLGGLDEYHQSFVPTREVTVTDWLADVSGAIAASLVYLQIKKRKRQYDNQV